MTTDIDIFLCHNSKDKPIVEKINQALKVKDSNLKTWIDKDNITHGEAFQQAIQEAIPKTKSAAIFFGLHGVGPWQKQEIDALFREKVNREKVGRNIRLIPILLPGVKQIPDEFLFLQGIHYLELSSHKIDEKFLNALASGIKEKQYHGTQPNRPTPLQINNWLISIISTVILGLGFIMYKVLVPGSRTTTLTINSQESYSPGRFLTPGSGETSPYISPGKGGSEPDIIPEITPFTPQAVPTEPQTYYDIGVYGYQVDESLFNKIKDSVGYPVREASKVFNTKQSWFANRPTVLYYDHSSEDFALSLAQRLTTSSGIQFVVQYVSRENAISVTPGNERWTFFVHIINE